MDNLKAYLGKTIKAIIEGDSFTQIVFTDGTFIIISKEVIPSELLLLPEASTTSEDDTEDEDEDEEDDEEDDDDEDDTEDEDEDEEDDEDDDEDEDEDEDEEFWTKEDIEDLDRSELVELISDEDLSIEPEDYPSDKKLRKAVIKALGL